MKKQLIEFRKEVGIMMKLRPHANVLGLLGVCTRNMLCIVTEYLPNGSLEKYLESHTIDDVGVIKMGKEIAAGMQLEIFC
jgi:serine/threonine protein kinase